MVNVFFQNEDLLHEKDSLINNYAMAYTVPRQSRKLCYYSPYCDQSRYLTIIELIMCACVCGNRLLERPMSPSPKSQVMFASAFSWIGDFFLVFLAFKLVTLRPLCSIYEYACYERNRDTPSAHALTPAALTSCARVRSLAISRILFEHMSRARRPLIVTTGTRVWTLNPGSNNTNNNRTIYFGIALVHSVSHLYPTTVKRVINSQCGIMQLYK